MTSRIVLIAADPSMIQTFRDTATQRKVELAVQGSVDGGLSEMGRGDCGLVFVSLSACGGDTAGALSMLRARHARVPLYLIAAPEEPLPETEGWFEVVRTPIRTNVLGWIVDAVLLARPSRLFKLYVTGRAEYAQLCAARVQRMLETWDRGGFDLEVVDVLREPNRARADHVTATPTLVRVGPKPRQQLVGVDEARIARIWDPTEVRW